MNGILTSMIDMLTKDNYDTWKAHMEALLVKCDMWELVSGGIVKPDGAAGVVWDKNDRKAKLGNPKRVESNIEHFRCRLKEIAEREKMIANYQKPQIPQSKTFFGHVERPLERKPPEMSRSHLDLRQLLRRNSDSTDEDVDTSGPYDFRQLLRPAKHLPTESLRKRKGFVLPETQTTLIQPCDSPSKRRAQKC